MKEILEQLGGHFKKISNPETPSYETAAAATIGFGALTATAYLHSYISYIDPFYLALILTATSGTVFTMQYGPAKTGQEALAIGSQLLNETQRQSTRAIKFFKDKCTGGSEQAAAVNSEELAEEEDQASKFKHD